MTLALFIRMRFSIMIKMHREYSLIQYKGYNSKLKIFDSVQFRKYFISLPAFYLVIWLMKSPKNFEKICILKIWQLVFSCGVKSGFGENKLIKSLKYWFMEAKNVFRSSYGPKKWPKYHIKTILTTFSERNEYYGAILVKINFCHAWKCMISGVFHQTGFSHLWRKPAVIFSKWMFFQNSLVIPLAI